MPGTKTLWVSTPHHNQYWKLHWLWLLTDLSGNNRTLDYWVSLSSEWSDKACCHKPGTRNTLLRNLAKKIKKIKKTQTPVSFNWGKQFLPAGENFSKKMALFQFRHSVSGKNLKCKNVPKASCKSEILLFSNPATLLACIKSVSKMHYPIKS